MYICASPGNTIANNCVTTNGNEAGRGGIDIYGSSNNIISGNYVANNFDGINVDYGSTNTAVVGNNIRNNIIGIYVFNIVNSHDNNFYHNNLVGNLQQVSIDNSPNISWDNGYPSGGNSWSNYHGVDANGDGIGDTAYVIDTHNTDRYPLMTPTRSIPILIVTPQNGDYYRNNSVPLTFIVNEEFSIFWYALDDRGNFTLTGNTTLTGLSMGAHNLIVYGHTLHGETKASDRVTFTIMTNVAYDA
jgi:hypothetical protein